MLMLLKHWETAEIDFSKHFYGNVGSLNIPQVNQGIFNHREERQREGRERTKSFPHEVSISKPLTVTFRPAQAEPLPAFLNLSYVRVSDETSIKNALNEI